MSTRGLCPTCQRWIYLRNVYLQELGGSGRVCPMCSLPLPPETEAGPAVHHTGPRLRRSNRRLSFVFEGSAVGKDASR